MQMNNFEKIILPWKLKPLPWQTINKQQNICTNTITELIMPIMPLMLHNFVKVSNDRPMFMKQNELTWG